MRFKKNYKKHVRHSTVSSARKEEMREEMYTLCAKAIANGNDSAIDTITSSYNVSVDPVSNSAWRV